MTNPAISPSKFQGLPWESWSNASGQTSPSTNMTNPMISPSKFQGLPWESWTNALGRTSPIADKPPEPKSADKTKNFVTKLPKEDMKIFGLCPEKDTFSIVKCESCGMFVIPQALLHHIETRHSDLPSENPPTQPPTEAAATSEKVKIKTKVKTSSKKTPSKDSKGRDGSVNPPPSLPVSLTLETPISEAGSSKCESLQPIVALTPLTGASTPAAPTGHPPPAVAKTIRRPPRKHAPIKEREYDPDKHCGVINTETMKPCTWSLTCKSHPMSLRRAVTGRSKPFDQLLADHRQAKEALIQAKKKNLEHQNATATSTPPTAVQPSVLPVMEPKSLVLEKINVGEPMSKLLQRIPELRLNLTSKDPRYLSAVPPSLVINGPSNTATVTTATANASSAPNEVVAYTFNHPRALGVPSMFSTHKIGGLVYTNRRMQIARQGLESCLHRAGNGIYMSAHRGDIYSQPSSLSNVLNHVSSRAALQKKRPKVDKSTKPNKKVCLPKESSLHDLQVNNLKSVLSRQYPNTQNRMIAPTTTESTFHIPNILSNALKRPSDVTPSKIQKKSKKKSSPIMNCVLSNHSKNGLTPSTKSSAPPYVRAIVNGKVEETKTLSLGEAPKFTNSNKILNESDLRKMGLRFEIFE